MVAHLATEADDKRNINLTREDLTENRDCFKRYDCEYFAIGVDWIVLGGDRG